MACKTKLAAALTFLATLSVIFPLAAQQRVASLYTVGNVRSEAAADNAVEAKKIAAARAQERALRLLLIRLTDFRAQSRLPTVSPEEIDRLVSNTEVRGEGYSGTDYGATFTITFAERGIRALLSQQGLTPLEDRSPEILIIPVYIEDGSARSSDRNPWRKALNDLDLTHGFVPARLAPSRSDISAAVANAYISNAASSLETLKGQYKAQQVLFAVAEDAGDVLVVKLIGIDALGTFSLQRKIKASDGIDDGIMKTAAGMALGTVEQRWKLARGAVYTTASNAGSDSSAGPSFTGGASPVQITVEYSGLKEWQTIRNKLQKIPGIGNWDLRSVNPRSAQVSLDFPGGAERLVTFALQQGLSMDQDSNGWVVRTR